MTQEDQEMRDLFLLTILPHVAFEGWSKGAIAAGIADVDYLNKREKETFELAFPGGLSELANIFLTGLTVAWSVKWASWIWLQ